MHKMGRHKMKWICARIIAVVGLGVSVDLFLSMQVPSARAESLQVKPGAWEMSVTTVASGMKLTPEMAAKMTPLQRAQMEQMMKAREGKSHTTTLQSCLTKEDVSQDRIIKEMEDEDDDGEVQCKVKVISKSSSKLVIDKICPGPSPSTTHFTIEAKTTDSLVATGDREQQGSGKSHMDIKGRWLGAGCEGIEE
jgi:hypothetical protein